MKTTIYETSRLSERPKSIVRSYSGTNEFLTLNVGVSQYEDKSEDIPDGSRTRYQCTTVSLSNDGKTDTGTLFKILWQNDIYRLFDSSFLSDIVNDFSINDYETFAAILVAGRYSYAEELACHRKALCGETDELKALNAFVDECKKMAREVFNK